MTTPRLIKHEQAVEHEMLTGMITTREPGVCQFGPRLSPFLAGMNFLFVENRTSGVCARPAAAGVLI